LDAVKGQVNRDKSNDEVLDNQKLYNVRLL